MKPLVIAGVFGVLAWTSSSAQQPATNTEVYLVDYRALGTGAMSGKPLPESTGLVVNISNSAGYDNQPSFTPDGKAVLFTSDRQGDQTDIYKYDIAAKSLVRLTRTPEKEYSPLVTPDGRTFTVIRVEADNTQRLWRFDADGSNPKLVLENVKPVGYHVWIDNTHVAVFVLGSQGSPATLQIADTATGKAEVVASNVGRSLGLRPMAKGHPLLTYVNKEKTPWAIFGMDPEQRIPRFLAPLTADGSPQGAPPAPPGPARNEDYAWQFNGYSAVFAWGTKLEGFSPVDSARGGSSWQGEIDLAPFGVKNITRLAVSRDSRWLAFVAEPVTK